MVAHYNRFFAAAYAKNYALNYNDAWIADTEDCTNFVSQALYFGGWPMVTNHENDITAWYNISEPDSFLGDRFARGYQRSKTWAAAQNFMHFLMFSGRAHLCTINDLTFGDVVQHSTHGRTSHTMMITGHAASSAKVPATAGLTNTVLLASYHSRDRLDVPLILLNSPSINLFWKIHDYVAGEKTFGDEYMEKNTNKRWLGS